MKPIVRYKPRESVGVLNDLNEPFSKHRVISAILLASLRHGRILDVLSRGRDNDVYDHGDDFCERGDNIYAW